MRQLSHVAVVVTVFNMIGALPAFAQEADTATRRTGVPAATTLVAIASSESPAVSLGASELSAVSPGAPESLAVSPGAPESPAPTEQREWSGFGRKWSNWSRMTGDWGRLRTDLEDRGLSFQVATISDVSGLAAGPSRTQGFGRQLTTIELMFDLEKIAGLTGGRLLVQRQEMGGVNGASLADATQGVSNIDADAFSRFSEVWFEQQVGARVRVKTGLIDANKEFAFVENGADFINPSMGFSPTIFPLPTYPDPHMGLVVHVDPTERTYAAAGLFNGGPAMGVADFRALLAMGEVGLSWEGWGGGRVGVGYWHVGGDRADADEMIQPVATGGQYVVVDQRLWADERDGGARAIGAFFQAGLADPRLCAISSHIGGGLVAHGLVAGRSEDAIGIGVTTVGLAALEPGDPLGRREVDVDVFYRLALTKWVALKPDVQFIGYPGWDPGRPTTVAGTIRIEVGF